MRPALKPQQSTALERLRLVSRRNAISPMPGRRTGAGAGQSVDFADYRRYSPGDDVRYVDWNLYARLGRLYSRQFRAEADLNVHILLDVSASMSFGEHDKLACARQIVKALSYVALRQLDPVGLATFSGQLQQWLPPQRSGGQLLRILELLEQLQPGGSTDFERAARDYVGRSPRAGLAIVVSDLLSPQGAHRGLELLLHKRFELVLVQVLADEELAPEVEWNVELRDLEDPAADAIAVGPPSITTYLDNLTGFQESLDAFCHRHRVRLARVSSSSEFPRLILELLRQGVWERV